MPLEIRYLHRVEEHINNSLLPHQLRIAHKQIGELLEKIHCVKTSRKFGLKPNHSGEKEPWIYEAYKGRDFLSEVFVGPNPFHQNLVYLGLIMAGSHQLLECIVTGLNKNLGLTRLESMKTDEITKQSPDFYEKFKTIRELMRKEGLAFPEYFE